MTAQDEVRRPAFCKLTGVNARGFGAESERVEVVRVRAASAIACAISLRNGEPTCASTQNRPP